MPGPRPRWGVVSVIAPVVGFILGLTVWAEGWWMLWRGHHLDGPWCGLVTWAAFSACGLVAAGIAWARHERSWLITAAGFVLSALLPAAFLCAGASSLINWLRFG